MSHDNQSDAIGLLTSKGLSGEEAQAVADVRAKAPTGLPAAPLVSEGGTVWRLAAFWMAVGFLSLLTIGRVIQTATMIGFSFSQASRIFFLVGSLAAPSVFCCGAIWLLAKGKFDFIARPLACRYRRPSRLRDDLGIALFF